MPTYTLTSSTPVHLTRDDSGHWYLHHSNTVVLLHTEPVPAPFEPLTAREIFGITCAAVLIVCVCLALDRICQRTRQIR